MRKREKEGGEGGKEERDDNIPSRAGLRTERESIWSGLGQLLSLLQRELTLANCEPLTFTTTRSVVSTGLETSNCFS